jgi:hypothetical protein
MTLQDICSSGLHCRFCRLKERGRAWRASLVAALTPGMGADFACPSGRPWTEEGRTVTPALLADAPPALRTCGPFWSAYRQIEDSPAGALLKGYARQLAWIVQRRSCQQERMAAKLEWYRQNVGTAA